MLAILIVNWNVRDLLRACLMSLQAHPATTHDQVIVVVDNASVDGSVEMVRTEFPEVHLIGNTTNRGFTGGNNDGLREIGDWGLEIGDSFNPDLQSPIPKSQADYVLLLNPGHRSDRRRARCNAGFC